MKFTKVEIRIELDVKFGKNQISTIIFKNFYSTNLIFIVFRITILHLTRTGKMITWKSTKFKVASFEGRVSHSLIHANEFKRMTFSVE